MIRHSSRVNANQNYNSKVAPPMQDEFIKVLPQFRRIFEERKPLSELVYSICLLGVTGHGKSSTANSLCGEEFFSVSSGVDSETKRVVGLVTSFFEKPDKRPILVLDTPGFGDTKGNDTAHVADIVNRLKTVGFVHTFIIILNSEDPRFDEQLQATLRIFQQMFGSDFFLNVLLCFTKFSTDARSASERERGRKPKKDRLIREISEKFRFHYKYSLKDDQFVFINNGVLEDEYAEPEELTEFSLALNHIYNFTERKARSPFYCNDIQKVMTEKNALENKIIQILENAERERKEFANKLASYQQIIREYERKNQTLNNKLNDLKNSLNQMEERHRRINNEHENEIIRLKNSFRTENQANERKFMEEQSRLKNKIEEYKRDQERKLTQLEESNERERQQRERQHREARDRLNDKIREISNKL